VIIYAAIYISPVRSDRQERYTKQTVRKIIIIIIIIISESHNLCQNRRVCTVHQVHAQEFSESAGDNQGSPRWATQNQNQAFLTCQPHTIQSNPWPLLSPSLALMRCHATTNNACSSTPLSHLAVDPPAPSNRQSDKDHTNSQREKTHKTPRKLTYADSTPASHSTIVSVITSSSVKFPQPWKPAAVDGSFDSRAKVANR
jgi:hypothetical protein